MSGSDANPSIPSELEASSETFKESPGDTNSRSSTLYNGTRLAPAIRLLPVSPDTSQRYVRRRTLDDGLTEYTVRPLSRSFSRPNVPNWTPRLHPEGNLYFVHDQHRIFTDAYLCDEELLAQINSAVDLLLGWPDVQQLMHNESDHIDIVLDLMKETPENTDCGYYLVDHSSRLLFWLHEFQMSTQRAWKKVPGIRTPSHVRIALEAAYWRHCDQFPAAISLSARLVHELRGSIMFGLVDAMTSPTTTIPFPVEHMFRMLQLTAELSSEVCVAEESDSKGILADHGSINVLTRFMKQFTMERFTNLHGERTARLDRRQSVYGCSTKPSYLLFCLSPFLFNVPLNYLRTIERMYMDRLMNYRSWNKLMSSLHAGWRELIFYGTLLLNINVGFLAVPVTSTSRDAQLASYVSTCLGLGSIVLGLTLLRLYPFEASEAPTSEKAVAFFRRHQDRLEVLCIVWSLPYALMIWGTIMFILAFLLSVLQNSTAEIRGIVLATNVVICVSMVSCIVAEKHNVSHLLSETIKFPIESVRQWTAAFARWVDDLGASEQKIETV